MSVMAEMDGALHMTLQEDDEDAVDRGTSWLSTIW